MNAWYTYVVDVGGTENQSDLARRTGLTQSTFAKWKSGTQPTPQRAAAFARALDRNLLEAFVAAGWLTSNEAGCPPQTTVDPSLLSTAALFAELKRRTREH